MADRWALAFSASALLAVVAGAQLRLSARGSSSARLIRRSGGVVLVASLAGWVLAPDRPRELLALAPAMVAFAVIGVLADHGRLRDRYLALSILAVSIVPVVGGARVEFFGVPTTDAVVTVLWIAGVTAAVAGLGNTDGLLASVAGATAGGAFGLAAFGDQDGFAAVAAALAGACLGFLTYNLRPASLFVGQAGGMPTGAVLAVAAIEIEPAIASPGSLAVPLILLGLPITDAATVAFTRLRHRRRLTTRRPDHLPHRLRALGWRTARVVQVLVAVQLTLSVVAIFVGRGVLPVGPGAAVAALPLVVLAIAAGRGRVYEERAEGISGRVVLLVLGVGVAATLASIPGVLAGIESRRSLEDGRRLAERAISAARRGDPEVAAERFEEASAAFAAAHDRLYNPVVLGGLVVPVLGANLHATRELADAGLDLARAGERLTGPVDQDKLRVRDGTIPLDEVRRITPGLEEAADLLSGTEDRVADIHTGFLVAPVREALDKVERELARAEQDAARGAGAARLAPEVLGGNGPRRYFLAVQNPAELRATGGFIGSWGILTAENGKVDLEFIRRVGVLNEGGDRSRTISGPEEYLRRYGRFEPELTWQNVNMSPEFPVVGQVIAELYPESGGEEVDGVVAVDPVGLAALLELTGPVPVEGWPVPITADNVVDVTLSQAYVAFEATPERADFLGDVAEEVVDVATESDDLGRPSRIAEVLGRASREGHVSVYFTRPEEQALSELVNTEGSVPRPDGDSLMVVTQNAGANKLDYYLRRHVDYSVTIDPVGSGEYAEVTGQVDVALENSAPDSGLPVAVIGPAEGLEDRFVAGENFSFVSVYTPSRVTRSDLEHNVTSLESDRELGRNVFATFVSTFAGSTTTVSLDVAGAVRLPDDWYELEIIPQPFVAPDDVSVRLEVPDGWRIAEVDGLTRDGDRAAEGRVEARESTSVRVRLEPAGGRTLWDRLHHGP